MMQQAMVAALKATNQPIPPPLFVALGYAVRQETSVKIESDEVPWKTEMSSLYLVQQETTLRREHERFLVQPPDEPQIEIPIREVERVLVFGNVQLTTSAISSCLSAHIPVVLVVYDIPDDGRRLRLSYFLEGYGRRVQQSVFECFLSLDDMKKLYQQVHRRVKPKEDNVRFYWIPSDALPRTLTIGSEPPQLPPELYIV